MKRAEITQKLSSIVDKISISRAGVITAKRVFFYRHGCSAKKLAEEIQKALPEAKILNSEERWNPWPRDSFWLVQFEIPSLEELRIRELEAEGLTRSDAQAVQEAEQMAQDRKAVKNTQ